MAYNAPPLYYTGDPHNSGTPSNCLSAIVPRTTIFIHQFLNLNFDEKYMAIFELFIDNSKLQFSWKSNLYSNSYLYIKTLLSFEEKIIIELITSSYQNSSAPFLRNEFLKIFEDVLRFYVDVGDILEVFSWKIFSRK